MAICFSNSDCTNRTNFMVMGKKEINHGDLPVFTVKLPKNDTWNITSYKLKLIFSDLSEGDSEWFTMMTAGISNATTLKDKHYQQQPPLIYENDDDIRRKTQEIFHLMCFTVSALIVMLLKLCIKFVRLLLTNHMNIVLNK